MAGSKTLGTFLVLYDTLHPDRSRTRDQVHLRMFELMKHISDPPIQNDSISKRLLRCR